MKDNGRGSLRWLREGVNWAQERGELGVYSMNVRLLRGAWYQDIINCMAL